MTHGDPLGGARGARREVDIQRVGVERGGTALGKQAAIGTRVDDILEAYHQVAIESLPCSIEVLRIRKHDGSSELIDDGAGARCRLTHVDNRVAATGIDGAEHSRERLGALLHVAGDGAALVDDAGKIGANGAGASHEVEEAHLVVLVGKRDLIGHFLRPFLKPLEYVSHNLFL